MFFSANGEVVRETSTGSDRTLCKPNSTVHTVLVFHAQAVPMKRYTFILNAIVNMNHKSVTRPGLDEGSWKLICESQ